MNFCGAILWLCVKCGFHLLVAAIRHSIRNLYTMSSSSPSSSSHHTTRRLQNPQQCFFTLSWEWFIWKISEMGKKKLYNNIAALFSPTIAPIQHIKWFLLRQRRGMFSVFSFHHHSSSFFTDPKQVFASFLLFFFSPVLYHRFCDTCGSLHHSSQLASPSVQHAIQFNDDEGRKWTK